MISSHANTGAYAFSSAALLRSYCIRLLDAAVGVSGEYFTTNILRAMLDDGLQVLGLYVPTSEFVCVGTPTQLQQFLGTIKAHQMEKAVADRQRKSKEAALAAAAAAAAAAAGSPITGSPMPARQQSADYPPSLVLPSPSPSHSAPPFAMSGLPSRPIRFCFDLDNTLVSYPVVPGDYSTCEPKLGNIRLVRELHAAGHYIIIQTARRMKTHNGNVGAVIRDIGAVTMESLKKLQIPYHELLFGKPYADVYVDDLAVHALIDTDKEVGWAMGGQDDEEDAANLTLPSTPGSLIAALPASWNAASNVPSQAAAGRAAVGASAPCFISPRHFNSIQQLEERVIKSSLTSNIAGEVYFYQHIPPSIANLFPALIRVDHGQVQVQESGLAHADTITSLVIERIRGVAFTHLLIDHCVTEGRLLLLLKGLKRMHEVKREEEAHANKTADGVGATVAASAQAAPTPAAAVDIYANYSTKLQSRFDQWKQGYQMLDVMLEASEIRNAAAGASAAARPDSATLCAQLVSALSEYASGGFGAYSDVIHGDPVLSNVLLTPASSVVFLDMRGRQGSVLTTAGDQHYDLAKVLQSLYGYDFVLMGQGDKAHTNNTASSNSSSSHAPPTVLQSDLSHRASYLSGLQSVLFRWVAAEYPRARPAHLHLLVSSLFFSLIPLHDHAGRQMCFLRLAHHAFQNFKAESK